MYDFWEKLVKAFKAQSSAGDIMVFNYVLIYKGCKFEHIQTNCGELCSDVASALSRYIELGLIKEEDNHYFC